MANQPRGLPSGFGIKVPATATQRPVDIGDYLDDDSPAVSPPIVTPKRTPPAAAVPSQPVLRETPTPRPEKPREQVAAASTSRDVQPAEETATQESSPAVVRKNPPRKQINMKPETLRKAEELVRHVQTFSVQKDTKASEVFDALVELLHDAKKNLEFSTVPPRGQWGSPTARGFRTSLKNAFAKAIVELQQSKDRS